MCKIRCGCKSDFFSVFYYISSFEDIGNSKIMVEVQLLRCYDAKLQR